MSQADQDQRIDYVEFATADIAATKRFYGNVFGWKFEDYGPNYTAFRDGRIGGGFAKSTAVLPGGALIVIYAVDLEAAEVAVASADGRITKEIFSFPGGRRFHFADPSANELAVCSDQNSASQ